MAMKSFACMLLARAARSTKPRRGAVAVISSTDCSKPASTKACLISRASWRLKAYSGTPRALIAPGTSTVWPTSTTTRNEARAQLSEPAWLALWARCCARNSCSPAASSVMAITTPSCVAARHTPVMRPPSYRNGRRLIARPYRAVNAGAGYAARRRLRAACRVLPPALLHRLIVSSGARTRIGRLGVPVALEKEAEAVVAPVVAARNGDIDRRPAHQEAALGLVAEHRDELGAIIGLAAQRLVRDDDRGSRQCSRRDAIEHILRDGDAVERVLGVVPVVDRDRGPAQARVVARHRCEHMRAERLVGIADRDRNLNGRIEHLTPVRPRLMRVAPYVKLLRCAADVNRDRLERELRLACRLGGGGLLGLGRIGRGVELRLRVGLGSVELRPCLRGIGGRLLPQLVGPRLGLVRLCGGECLVGEHELCVGAGLEPFKLAQRRRERCCLARRCCGGFLRLVGRFGGLRGLASERLGTRRSSRDGLRVRHE